MFDSTPSNLPVETSGQPPMAPPQSAAPINVPGTTEPEDIFSDIKEPSTPAQAMRSAVPPVPRGGFPWKVVIGIGIPAAVLVLGIGGWYVYRAYKPVTATSVVPKTQTLPTTVPAVSEPNNADKNLQNPVPPPDENQAAANQATVAMMREQAAKEEAQAAAEAAAATSTAFAALPSATSTMEQPSPTAGSAGNAPETPPAAGAPANLPPPSLNAQNGTAPLVMGTDTDQDGLTNSEELLLGTNPSNKDTNGNGYMDGTEVRNGYDPLVKSQKIEASKYLKTETIGQARILIPAVWTRRAGMGGTEMIMTGAPATISLSMESFASPMALMDWLTVKYPGSGAADYIAEKTAAGADVVYSKDRLTAWVLLGNTVYTYRYATNGATSLDFGTLFWLMINRMQLAP